MSPMHAEHSPDESITGNHAPVQVTRITLPPTRDLVLGTLLAIALLGNIFLFAYAKDAKTLAWVTADALQKFQTTQLPGLESRIQVAEELTKTYRLEKEIGNHNQPQPQTGSRSAGGH